MTPGGIPRRTPWPSYNRADQRLAIVVANFNTGA
jgi:hypothetical protein